MDPLAIDPPALAAQQRPDPPIPKPWMITNQFMHALHDGLLLIVHDRLIPRRGPRLIDGLTRPTLRHGERRTQMRHRSSSTRRAQNSPLATSLSIAMSKA